MAQFFEAAMIIIFGLSWPNNILKSIKSKSTKGKSLLFLVLVDTGYLCGITGKLIAGDYKVYVLFFYFLNFFMVLTDIVLYLYYYSREKQSKTAMQ